MTQEAIQTLQLSVPFYKNSVSSWHRLCRANKIATVVIWSSINENWLNVKINQDTKTDQGDHAANFCR
jgi:hypothetical protein